MNRAGWIRYPNRQHGSEDPGGNNVGTPPQWGNASLDSSSFKNLTDAERAQFLTNSEYLSGVVVDAIEGPRRSKRPVAYIKLQGLPLVREVKDIATETITTKGQRASNYVHQGWSLAAVSTTSPWISSRITRNKQPSVDGTWVTKRMIVPQISLSIRAEELSPMPEFETEIESALQQPTTFERFQAVYAALDIWGDVLPLQIDIGISLSFTDLESNISKLPITGSYNTLRGLLAIKSLQVITKGGDRSLPDWNDEKWSMAEIPPLKWSQVRVTRVVPTTSILSEKLQAQLHELYAERLTYSPVLPTKGTEGYTTFDDNQHALKTVSRIIIRACTFIDCLSITYLDRTQSNSHGGRGGTEHQFTLLDGEHITEILIWSNQEWVCGLQFLTNTGRISPHYGGTGGTPTVAHSNGGIMTGFSTMVRKHPQCGNLLVSRIQGIWRRDLVGKVPKELYAFSTYIGGGGGTPFSDRPVVGNNSSRCISRVDIGCWDLVDSIQIAYVNRSNGGSIESVAPRHGGSGGAKKSFTLDPEEHIISVSGRHSDRLVVQLCFETSKGRKSATFGGSGGQYFRIPAPTSSSGGRMRLHYICGKSGSYVDGLMFVWAPI